MKIDVYTKSVLTIIAACLVCIVFRDMPLISTAHAEVPTASTRVDIVAIEGVPISNINTQLSPGRRRPLDGGIPCVASLADFRQYCLSSQSIWNLPGPSSRREGIPFLPALADCPRDATAGSDAGESVLTPESEAPLFLIL